MVIGACALPSVHSPGVGNALVLQRPARVGAAGAAVDLLRTAAGIRVLAALVWTCFVMTPPLATLVGRLVIVVRCWNPAGYCSTQVSYFCPRRWDAA